MRWIGRGMNRFLGILMLLFATAATSVEEELSLEDALEGFDAGVEGELSVEGALEGFDEELPNLAATAIIDEPDEQEVASLRGHWVSGGSWNISGESPTSDRLTRLSTKLWLEAEQNLGEGWKFHGEGFLRYDLAHEINGRDHYTDGVLDTYEHDEEIGELWLQGGVTPDLDLKVGRQIVVWGQSDHLRVNDVINPIDLREPGLVDIETLRRPVGMVRGDYYHGPWRWSALLIPENRPNLSAPCGSEYSLAGVATQASCDADAVPSDLPGDGIGDAEFALSAMGRFSGWDLSLYGGRLNYNTPYKDGTGSSNIMRNARVNHLGGAVNIAEGSWLWKGEVALIDGLRYFNTGSSEKSRVDLLLGGEYRGFADTTLSFEILRRHINSHDASLTSATDYVDENSWQSVVAYTQDLQNDTLHLNGVLLRNGSGLDEGGYLRLSAQYDIDDAWSASGGGIWYDAAKYPPNWGDNDRLFVEIRRDF